jgi:hypothetical protein
MDDDERGMDHSAHEDCVGCRNCGVLHVVEFGGFAATAAAVNTAARTTRRFQGMNRERVLPLAASLAQGVASKRSITKAITISTD